MYEVVITFRSDFSEKVIGRFATLDEAQEVARRVATQHTDKIVRGRVREVRQVKSKN